MALIVRKYGGSSVADLEKIRNIARKLVDLRREGNDLIVVLSAMKGETDRLINLAKEINPRPDPREMDCLVSIGEQTTVSLMAMTLIGMGQDAVSLLGHQARILTDNAFGSARIENVDASRMRDELKKGRIVVVAGFQGIDPDENITTLGRGGSDTTAVALAAAVSADVCEIFTDVTGVFTTDPNVVPKARKLDRISYDEMMEMASLGAKVLEIRSVEYAKNYNVPLHVRSTFSDEQGTMVVKEDKNMEKQVVSGVAYDKNEARLTVTKVPDRPGIAYKILKPISDANIVVDMIIQNTRAEDMTDITFTVPKKDFQTAMHLLQETAKEIGATRVLGDDNISKVSIVGVGMRNHPGVATEMFGVLSQHNINIMMISTSEIKISCVIDEKYTELAVRVLHDAFGLGKDPKEAHQ
ncbi:MAG: aspartate kinase [Deltaproteobacteria bacterium]|nr:aspartate kinase [Deltaproteobacteria bacterium]